MRLFFNLIFLTLFLCLYSAHSFRLATKAILLGSGGLGKEVLIALQRLSVETIATYRYDNTPGQHVPHHARTFATNGPALIKALNKKEKSFIYLNASNKIHTVKSIRQ